MKTALLLIDLQNDYFPNGKMELVDINNASQNAKSLLEYFRSTNQPIIHIQHISTRPTATFFLPDTIGTEIHESVKPINGETVIVKNSPNSFQKTDLLKTLENLHTKKLIIAGAMTHIPIAIKNVKILKKVLHCRSKYDQISEWNNFLTEQNAIA